MAKQEKPKEQIEYEEATKNIKVITAKLRLSQQGVDTSSISRQDIDRVIALYEKMDAIVADVRSKTSEIQRDSEIEIQRINQKANEKYSQASNDIGVVINKMKKAEKPTVDKLPEPVHVETKEEVKQEISPEKMKEDMINSLADRVLQKMRKEVVNILEDYTNVPQVKIVPAQDVPTVAPTPDPIPKDAPVSQVAKEEGASTQNVTNVPKVGISPSVVAIPKVTPIPQKVNEAVAKKAAIAAPKAAAAVVPKVVTDVKIAKEETVKK